MWRQLQWMAFMVHVLALVPQVSKGAENHWDPRAPFLKALVDATPGILESQDKATGRFGAKPWISTDQNCIFPLAAAWSIEDKGNPFHHSPEVLEAIMKGGDALIAAQDKRGMWTFRKKDNSTWGQIYMPWIYSRWIRAFYLIKDAMPAERRAHWEKGLRLGFDGISKTALRRVHNIPTHHAMGLHFAGLCFDRADWRKQAKAFMAKAAAKQASGGWWTEHSGPVVVYNFVYTDALGTYYAMTRDASVLPALRRSALFHATTVYPDGSLVETVDERNWYRRGVRFGNVGFSFTPEGRGYLRHQLERLEKPVSADTAASFLLYGGTGEAAPTTADQDRALTVIGKNQALMLRQKPWFVCLSAFVCRPSSARWIQDRQNLLSIYHDDVGLIVGGGNTKLQPFWSNFTVGNTSLLRHKPGDTRPNFNPTGDLVYLPRSASLTTNAANPRLQLRYGAETCTIGIRVENEKQLTVTYESTCKSGKPVEGHLTFLPRVAGELRCASGKKIKIGDKPFDWQSKTIGDAFEHHGRRTTVPAGARLVWPKKCHNPYRKDGRSDLEDARIVLCLPFSPEKIRHEVTLRVAH